LRYHPGLNLIRRIANASSSMQFGSARLHSVA
jgi:hypothetical protein